MIDPEKTISLFADSFISPWKTTFFEGGNVQRLCIGIV